MAMGMLGRPHLKLVDEGLRGGHKVPESKTEKHGQKNPQRQVAVQKRQLLHESLHCCTSSLWNVIKQRGKPGFHFGVKKASKASLISSRTLRKASMISSSVPTAFAGSAKTDVHPFAAARKNRTLVPGISA